MSNKNAELLQKYLNGRKTKPDPDKIKLELKKNINELDDVKKRIHNVCDRAPAN